MSPARMYSFARRRPSPRTRAGVVFETGGSKSMLRGSTARFERQRAVRARSSPRRGAPARSHRRPAPRCRPRAHGRDERNLVLHRIEHHHHGRADQDRVRHAARPGWAPAGAPSGAPCRSRDSRRGPPPWAADRRASGRALSWISARRLSRGARLSGSNALSRLERMPVDRGRRRPGSARSRSGSRPIIEKRPRTAPPSTDSSRKAGPLRSCRSFRKAATGVRRSPDEGRAQTTPASPAS